jgi:hypothetical protein
VAIRPLDRKRIEVLLTEYCGRVPERVRHQLRNGFRFRGSAVELFEERPHWDDDSKWMEHPVAKFRWVATQELWQLYCVHRDLKWHSYERLPVAGSFEVLLREVDKDPTGIFWG